MALVNLRKDLMERLNAVRDELECSYSDAMDVLLDGSGEEDEEDEEDGEDGEEEDD